MGTQDSTEEFYLETQNPASGKSAANVNSDLSNPTELAKAAHR